MENRRCKFGRLYTLWLSTAISSVIIHKRLVNTRDLESFITTFEVVGLALSTSFQKFAHVSKTACSEAVLHLCFFASRGVSGALVGRAPSPATLARSPTPGSGFTQDWCTLRKAGRGRPAQSRGTAPRGPPNVTNPSLFSTDIAVLFAAKPRCATLQLTDVAKCGTGIRACVALVLRPFVRRRRTSDPDGADQANSIVVAQSLKRVLPRKPPFS